ncbi:Hpt domain-containing protein [Bernardetia sp. OM2101]|uniref:Hpt domain-containing protein n=1 Tax=Bernardetia sp. OM2101 TaxID=3344876 RepID=UPI0035D0DA69
MPNKILSKNISSSSEFNARKLSFVSNRIQIFYIDEKGFIMKTCDGIWQIKQNQDVNFFDTFETFKFHKEAIDFLLKNTEKNTNREQKNLAINNLEIFFEEEFFYVDVLFTVKKNSETAKELFLECLIEDKTAYYQSLKNLEESHKLQEIEFLNEKWQLTKDAELSEVKHQEALTTLNEQLRVDWTNLLADNLKRTTTQNFIQYNSESDSKNKQSIENLIKLSASFEKISGIRLFPPKIKAFISTQKTFTYLGDNETHQLLIEKMIQLAGGKFVIYSDATQKEFDFSEIDFIFIEQHFIKKELENKKQSCLLVEPSFLENEQHLINNETNLLIYPLYPFQIWQQLLSFTNTNTMSYHEKIDLSQIYEIVDNEPMLVQNMLQILDKNLRDYPAQLQQEFKNGELDTLRQTVHKFKSCTAYTGLTQFNTTLSEIEASKENGWTIAQIKDKLEFVLQAIPVIKVQVEEKLSDLEKKMS